MSDTNPNFKSYVENRHLDNDLKKYIKENIPAGKKVSVVAVVEDGEAYNFAGQIELFLKLEGYRVDDLKQVDHTDPENGHLILIPDDISDVYQVIVGHNPRKP